MSVFIKPLWEKAEIELENILRGDHYGRVRRG